MHPTTMLLRSSLFAVALGATALAQNQLVVPAAALAGDLNSSTPYPFDTGAIRLQHIYDSSNFSLANGGSPLLLTGLRMRANGATATWNGDTIANVALRLSTAPIDFLAIGSSFAGNHGSDVLTVFDGPVAIAGGSSTLGQPGPWVADLRFDRPFRYDPSRGDLTIDILSSGVPNAINTPALDLSTTTGQALARRIYAIADPANAATGVIWNGEAALALEFTWLTGNALYADFGATPRSGGTPLQVTFADWSLTSVPTGPTSWAWDFQNDGIVDSTQQNPTFTFTGCGSYDVSLRVTDGLNPPSTVLKRGFVVTDIVTPDFTWTSAGPGLLQFRDTSTPAPTAWAWDFDGDSVVDSTAQNPTWQFPSTCATHRVSLTVNRMCRGPYAVTRDVRVATELLIRNDSSALVGNNALFDATIADPLGVSLCGVSFRLSGAVNAPITLDVYATPGSYAGNEQNPAVWRRLGGANGNVGTDPLATFVAIDPPVYLAAGNHGLALAMSGNVNLFHTNGATTASAAGLSITAGAATSLPFAGLLRSGFSVNARLFFSSCSTGGDAGYGFFGPGCAGTLGTTQLTASAPPRLGQALVVDLDNLPIGAAILMVGLSRTTSTLGPLPFDLGLFGAPGCPGRVSPDVTAFLLGAGNTARFQFGIPNTAVLYCLQFYHQALVLDQLANAMGTVTSDAAAAIVGR